MLITLEQLVKCNSGLNPEQCAFYIDSLNKILPKYEINTPLRIAHFLAQSIHESGNFKYKVENLNYSESALISVFGGYYSTTGGETSNLKNPTRTFIKRKAIGDARKPETIANWVYANRMENGPFESGDGWRYRGRGIKQITGKHNYRLFSEYSGIDCVNNPDLLSGDAETMVEAACWYWRHGNGDCNIDADKDDVLGVTKRINGGTIGLEERRVKTEFCKSILCKNNQNV